MTNSLLILAVVVLLLALLAARVPVGFSLFTAGAVGLALLDGFGLATRGIAAETYTSIAKYSLIVIPMFILMGMFAMRSGVASGAFRLAHHALKRIPGGLGVSTVVVCGVFAAVSGSSPATVATVGRIAIPEMRRAGYSREFVAGIVGTAGTLGVLIPPSIVAVIFGITTEVSIGQLLIAGILPGLLSVVVLSAYIGAHAVLKPSSVNETLGATEDGGATGRRDADVGAPTRTDLLSLLGVVAMFVTVIGGIYSGLFTATESAAFGALTGLVILVLSQVKKPGLGAALVAALKETASTTTMIFAIMIGASVFTNFLVRSGATRDVSRLILELDLSPYTLVVGTLLLMIPLGMFLDATSIIVITMPVLWPVLESSGVNGVWYGIMVIVMIEIGLITPPVGINAFVLSGITRDISIEQAFKGLLPFVFVQLAVVTIIFLAPGIATVLPALMKGS